MIDRVKPQQRNVAIDLIRVLACYLVVQIHVGEYYYIAPDGSVLPGNDAVWVGYMNSLGRCSVALFVMISGYFLLPIKMKTSDFFKKRFIRIVVPFILWCIIYAVCWALIGKTGWNQAFINILNLFVNFGTDLGHLWYIYMLFGLYMLAPIISPWIASASKREIEAVLLFWVVASSLNYIHLLFPQIWGECYWNPTPMLYYFTGFGGFFVLGGYLKRFHSEPRRIHYVLGALLLVTGYLITALVFEARLDQRWVQDLELSWGESSVNVAMMAFGIFMLLHGIRIDASSVWGRVIVSISAMSFGIYLLHMLLIPPFFEMIDPRMNTIAMKLPCISILVFVVSYFIIKVLSYLPKSKYLIG